MAMFTRAQMLFTIALFILPALTRADEKNPKDATRPQLGVIKLFDGRTIDGLTTWLEDTRHKDPRKVFRVTDGLLHITGDGMGAVITKKAYRDYHLILEFKWGTRTWARRKDQTRDSGLLIHSVGAEGGYRGIWIPSLEVQIIEGGVGDFILVNGNDDNGNPVPLSLTCEVDRDRDGEVIWKKGGKKETFNMQNNRRINWYGRDPDWDDVLGFRGPRDVDSPVGEWTRMEVICDGGHIRTLVNSTLVNEAFDSYPTHGKIQLQSELAEIFVRRWELWPLGSAPKTAHRSAEAGGSIIALPSYPEIE